MIISRATIRFMSPFLLASFAALTCYVPTTQAAMIATEQTLHATQPNTDRAHVEALLARADVTEQLQAAGVDPQQLQSRLASLTDEEVAAINGQLDTLPAGGDILGFTDIFPFVKKTVR